MSWNDDLFLVTSFPPSVFKLSATSYCHAGIDKGPPANIFTKGFSSTIVLSFWQVVEKNMKRGSDAENPKSLLPGIPSVADFMARNTDKSAMIHRRFDKLASRNLLVLESRLIQLEEEQDRLDSEDSAQPSPEAIRFALGWTAEQEEEEEDTNGRRSQLRADIQTAIKEYHKALLLFSQILHLGTPASRSIEGVQNWLDGGHSGMCKVAKREDGENSMVAYEDLISLYTPAEDDAVSRFVAKYLGIFFLDRSRSTKHEKYLNERTIHRFVTVQGTIIAIALLIVAMWVLWRLEDRMVAKLAAVTGFVTAFATWVALFTSAQRKEVFIATAAYAAVLVVYIGKA